MSRLELPREIWVLVAAALAVSLGYGIVAPVLPQFAKSFGVTTTLATVVVSAFAFMRLAFAPASGALSARFGERSMYMAGIVIVAASSAASAAAQSYWQLLVVRALGGVGSVMFTVAAMSLIIKLSPVHARGRASAAYGSGFLLGSILGPAVGGVLAPLGFRWPFVIYAAMLLVAAVIVFVAIPASVAQGGARLGTGAGNEAGVGEAIHEPKPMTVREAFQLRRFKIVLLTAFAQGWTNFGVRVAVVPLLASAIPGAPTWLAGAALMAFAAGNGLALTRSGYLSDLYGRKYLVVAGLVISGVFTVLMGVWDSTLLILVASFMGGFGSGAIQPSQQGAVADIIGDRPGSNVVSFFQQSSDLGQILGPIAAGLMIDHSGYLLAYVFSGAILLVAALIWVVGVRESGRGGA
ncbi:MFS transporter [Trueperella abortisuis]|uniref:MFS family permease n=1 Tax=Trueperella abortisuis TaxID=445930 RepID=A0ABT9PKU5_9ACTO|nr:MFS transporter [Trueperella abortisuis]MDP9833346.1 MFS family permease [Trueperella abortisuis]